MYPKVVPPALLPKRLQYAQSMMTTLDLAHWIVFDASAAVRALRAAIALALAPRSACGVSHEGRKSSRIPHHLAASFACLSFYNARLVATRAPVTRP